MGRGKGAGEGGSRLSLHIISLRKNMSLFSLISFSLSSLPPPLVRTTLHGHMAATSYPYRRAPSTNCSRAVFCAPLLLFFSFLFFSFLFISPALPCPIRKHVGQEHIRRQRLRYSNTSIGRRTHRMYDNSAVGRLKGWACLARFFILTLSLPTSLIRPSSWIVYLTGSLAFLLCSPGQSIKPVSLV